MDIVDRLKLFLNSKDITISQFADTCLIPRPSMTQILKGRNAKISDKLISKIHEAYPSLSVLWLMFGEGNMETGSNIEPTGAQTPSVQPQSGFLSPKNEKISTGANSYSDTPEFGTNEPPQREVREYEEQIPYGRRQSLGSSIKADPTSDGKPSAYSIQQPSNAQFSTSPQTDGSPCTFPPSRLNTQQEVPSAPSSIDFHPSGGNNTFGTSSKSNEENFTGTTPGVPHSAEEVARRLYPTLNSSKEENKGGSLSFQSEPVFAQGEKGSFTKHQMSSQKTPSSGDDKLGDSSKTIPVELPVDAAKRITNIVVFYSDNSFQSFSPC